MANLSSYISTNTPASLNDLSDLSTSGASTGEVLSVNSDGTFSFITIGGGSSVTAYTNFAAFPSADNTTGDMAFAEDTKALYVWDGSEWDRVHSGPDQIPDWVVEPNSTYQLANDGTASTATVEASDPEGFGITYDYDTSPSNQTQATIVNNNDGSFTFTPSTNNSDAGEFTMRFKATDGLNVIGKSSTFTLQFASYRYIKIVINSVQGGGSQAQVTELSIADANQTTSQVTAASFTSWSGSASSDPNTYLNTNTTGDASYHTNLTGMPFTLQIDLGATYDLGTGIKYLQVGTSDDGNRFPNSVTVYGATASDYSDEVLIVENASVPAYDSVRSMRLVDLDL